MLLSKDDAWGDLSQRTNPKWLRALLAMAFALVAIRMSLGVCMNP